MNHGPGRSRRRCPNSPFRQLRQPYRVGAASPHAGRLQAQAVGKGDSGIAWPRSARGRSRDCMGGRDTVGTVRPSSQGVGAARDPGIPSMVARLSAPGPSRPYPRRSQGWSALPVVGWGIVNLPVTPPRCIDHARPRRSLGRPAPALVSGRMHFPYTRRTLAGPRRCRGPVPDTDDARLHSYRHSIACLHAHADTLPDGVRGL